MYIGKTFPSEYEMELIRLKSSAGRAFFYGGKSLLAGGVGNYNEQMLWNPASSGKEMYVRKIIYSSTSASFGYLMRHGSTSGFTEVSTDPNKFNTSSPASVGNIWYRTSASPTSLSGHEYAIIGNFQNLQTNDNLIYDKISLVLEEGEGILMRSWIDDVPLAANFFWEEITI